MFSGFNLTFDETAILGDFYFETGKEIMGRKQKIICNNLQDYICNSDVLDGDLISQNWFPDVHADVFISHSHEDEKLVISLAGWLYKVFGIESFVDSCVWGYSNDLLKILDEEYCLKSNGCYSYKKRNNSTSHVHMMLSMALMKMMDRCESVFFVNTPYSISISNKIKDNNNTLSPWIYAEMEMTKMIRHKKLSEYRLSKINENYLDFNYKKDLKIRYNLSIEHLVSLDNNDLLKWQICGRKNICDIPFDKLYELKEILEEK